MDPEISHQPGIELMVHTLIMEKLGCKESEIAGDPSFANDIGADSLDLYELFMECEKQFNIVIPDEDAEKLNSVGTLIDYIKSKKEKKHIITNPD